MIAAFKAEFDAAPKAVPSDDEEEPYELSEAYELAQVRALIRESAFPEEDEFVAWQKEYAAGLERKGLHPHAADHMLNVALFGPLVYKSVAALFYATTTEAFEAKAKAIGEELDGKGGFPLMSCVYYALSHTVAKLELQKGKVEWSSAFYYPLSAAWDRVGDWVN